MLTLEDYARAVDPFLHKYWNDATMLLVVDTGLKRQNGLEWRKYDALVRRWIVWINSRPWKLQFFDYFLLEFMQLITKSISAWDHNNHSLFRQGKFVTASSTTFRSLLFRISTQKISVRIYIWLKPKVIVFPAWKVLKLENLFLCYSIMKFDHLSCIR
jgi:hypothetical protein